MPCCDKLTTAHGLHAAISIHVLVCQVSTVVRSYSHIAVMLRPQNAYAYSCSPGFLGARMLITFHQNNSGNSAVTDPSSSSEGAGPQD